MVNVVVRVLQLPGGLVHPRCLRAAESSFSSGASFDRAALSRNGGGRLADRGRRIPVYDGIMQYRLLGLQRIRYHVTIWTYHLTWNITAFIMIIAGILLMMGDARIAIV